MKPQRGIALEQTHQLGQRQGGWMSQQQMHMVWRAVDRQRSGTGLAGNATEIRVGISAKGIVEPWTPFLRGKHDVNEQERQGVSHAGFLTPLPGLCRPFSHDPHGLRRGLNSCAPAGAGRGERCCRSHGLRRGLNSCAPAGAGRGERCCRSHGLRHGLNSCAPAGAGRGERCCRSHGLRHGLNSCAPAGLRAQNESASCLCWACIASAAAWARSMASL